jgi:hypothetical protein
MVRKLLQNQDLLLNISLRNMVKVKIKNRQIK